MFWKLLRWKLLYLAMYTYSGIISIIVLAALRDEWQRFLADMAAAAVLGIAAFLLLRHLRHTRWEFYGGYYSDFEHCLYTVVFLATAAAGCWLLADVRPWAATGRYTDVAVMFYPLFPFSLLCLFLAGRHAQELIPFPDEYPAIDPPSDLAG